VFLDFRGSKSAVQIVQYPKGLLDLLDQVQKPLIGLIGLIGRLVILGISGSIWMLFKTARNTLREVIQVIWWLVGYLFGRTGRVSTCLLCCF
jgi:hypothetical protein